MRTEQVTVTLLEEGDYIHTPNGTAVVIEDATFDYKRGVKNDVKISHLDGYEYAPTVVDAYLCTPIIDLNNYPEKDYPILHQHFNDNY